MQVAKLSSQNAGLVLVFASEDRRHKFVLGIRCAQILQTDEIRESYSITCQPQPRIHCAAHPRHQRERNALLATVWDQCAFDQLGRDILVGKRELGGQRYH